MKLCNTKKEQEFDIKILHKFPIYSNTFEYIRIIHYLYSYSVIFSNQLIFVFVFGGKNLTNIIRICIRWKKITNNIRIRIWQQKNYEYYSYSYSVLKTLFAHLWLRRKGLELKYNIGTTTHPRYLYIFVFLYSCVAPPRRCFYGQVVQGSDQSIQSDRPPDIQV